MRENGLRVVFESSGETDEILTGNVCRGERKREGERGMENNKTRCIFSHVLPQYSAV